MGLNKIEVDEDLIRVLRWHFVDLNNRIIVYPSGFKCQIDTTTLIDKLDELLKSNLKRLKEK